MKKATVLSGLISSFIFLAGLIMKIMHWPGAGIALFSGVVLFAMVYSPLLFIGRNKLNLNGYQKFVHSASMLTMSVVSGSFLFKMMHWPGTGILVITANLLLVAMIPLLLIRASRENEAVRKMDYYNEVVILIMLTTFSLFLWLIMK